MKFSHPYWLAAGLVASVALIGMWRSYDVRQQAALVRFVAPRLLRQLTGSVWRTGRLLQRGLLLAATMCLFVALAGPLVGFRWEKISRRGNEVIFAIDTSRSMLTPDVKPNRLIRAKLAIDDMARQLDGDAIGIVAFAGSAYLVCPLTLDYAAFHESLDAVDIHTIPRGGTNISSAILEARAALRRHPGRDKILILVTDGEDLEGSALAAAREAGRDDGFKIYTVGAGTAEGDLMPLPPDQGGGFVKDDTGAFVKSHLDEDSLKAIAAQTGGSYVRLGSQGEDFDVFLRTAFGAVAKRDLIYRQQKIYIERYQWPLSASLLMLLTSLLVGSRRWHWRRGAAPARAGVTVAVMLVLTPIHSRGGEQIDASAQSSGVQSPLIQYNAGTFAYRAGQFPQATQSFKQSIKTAPSSDAKRLADQEDAYYDLGNALYRAGQRVEKSAPQDAIQTWTDAVKAYDTALQLRADDADSKFNRDLVQRKIDALRRPQNQGQGGGQGQGQGQGPSGQSNQGQSQSPNQASPPARPSPPPTGRQPTGPPDSPPPTAAVAPSAGSAQNEEPGRPQPAAAASSEAAAANDARAPGQMSPEEARELLDSAKSDEHHTLGVPLGPRDPDNAPDKPFKNW